MQETFFSGNRERWAQGLSRASRLDNNLPCQDIDNSELFQYFSVSKS